MSDHPVLKKLKLTNQDPVFIINAPSEFKHIVEKISTKVHTTPKQKYSFIHVFVKNLAEADKYLKDATQCLDGDGYFWVSYPKKSSKKYKSDISRDNGWKSLGELSFEGVTQISIDDDWSAIRFRHVDNIKTMKRHFALSEKGKERIKNNK